MTFFTENRPSLDEVIVVLEAHRTGTLTNIATKTVASLALCKKDFHGDTLVYIEREPVERLTLDGAVVSGNSDVGCWRLPYCDCRQRSDDVHSHYGRQRSLDNGVTFPLRELQTNHKYRFIRDINIDR